MPARNLCIIATRLLYAIWTAEIVTATFSPQRPPKKASWPASKCLHERVARGAARGADDLQHSVTAAFSCTLCSLRYPRRCGSVCRCAVMVWSSKFGRNFDQNLIPFWRNDFSKPNASREEIPAEGKLSVGGKKLRLPPPSQVGDARVQHGRGLARRGKLQPIHIST